MRTSYYIINIFISVFAALFLFSCGKSEGNAPSLDNLTNSLVISPNAVTMAVNNTQIFTATGGSGSYSYSIFSGSGSVLSTTGVFTAPGSAGTAVVRVTDGQGQYADAIITINSALQISPTSQSLSLNATHTFTSTGGVTPYTYSVVSGVGSINANSGLYTAPSSAGSATIRVTDGFGNTSDASVSVFATLGITPSTYSLAVNNTYTFSAGGGSTPYSFSILSGGGIINSTTGLYTAPASSGTATVRVTDNDGATADAVVTINDALQISPASQTTLINSNISFSATGGVSPYTYSILSGTGTINSVTGSFTAPAIIGSTTIRVTDVIGNTSDAIITVTSTLSISPTTYTLAVNNVHTFTGSGGTPPLSYSVFSGGGSVNSSTGEFTAPATSGTSTVRVTDSLGATSDAVVTINPALAISPTSQTTLVNSTITFSASGGILPYSFLIFSGGGSINSSTGEYTAPASNDNVVVRVTDSLGNISSANVTVTSALSISPTTHTLAVNNVHTFTGSGGTPPLSYSVFSGGGSINSSTGEFTAPATSGTSTVRVTDSLGATADAVVTINPALAISPTSQTLSVNSTLNFSASGGVSPYTYSIQSGGGSLNSSTGEYTAPAGAGSATVRVTDSLGNTSDSTLTITAGLGISPASTTLAVNNTQTFTGVGGSTPYVYSVISGGGSINSSSGLYTAPASAGSATVRVTDNLGGTADATITINAALAISPSTVTLAVNNIYTFTASGGVSPYVYSITSGGGSLNSSTGEYTAPASAGSATVRVTDSLNNTSESTVTINPALAISPATTVVLINSVTGFTGSNGVSPYSYSVVSGGGSINSSTGSYTAPASNGSVTLRVTDSLGNTADAAVTVTTTLGISPSTITLAVNNVTTFSATGGTSPFTFSIQSGGGSINSSTGAYTAPASAGAATVRVTDGLGATADATVTINSALAISPSTATIANGGTQAYSASGGVSPYTYSIVSGPGSINSSTGLYTSSSAGSVTIRVTDSLSNTSDASLTVNDVLSVSPTVAYVTVDSDLGLTPTGGLAPYTYSIVSDTSGGSIDTISGVYTAGATTGSATLRTTDSAAATADTTVTIYNSLTLSPLTLTIAVNATQTFTATGGVGTLTFSMVSGTGTINSSTGLYTAPNTAGSEVIQVADTIGNILTADITVVSQLTIVAPALKLPLFSTMTYSAILGSTPYVYSVVSGTGTVNSSTGLYTAPNTVGSGIVRVTDNGMNTSDSNITHVEPVELASGSAHTCARYNDGSVKCWGDGAYGQLGSGSTTDLGDVTTELGGALPFVNLGTGRTATALSAGIGHTCAILDNGSLKCWGQNTYGQLGLGDVNSRGDGANEMGDNLAAVNLGVGRTVSKVFAVGYITCALLDNNVTKCFGRNNAGQLGLGDTVNRGTASAQMGDTLAALNVGTGRTVNKISGGLDHTCALLDNSTVKCWGSATYGQIGSEAGVNIGDGAGEMGDSLATVNLGTGRTALDIGMGHFHSCAILDDNTVKCWGRNQSGELGFNSNAPNKTGDATGDMGDNLAAIPFTSFTATKVWSGRQTSCIQSSGGAVRCWGEAGYGQLLNGSTQDRGDGNNEIQNITDINFGTGVTVSQLSFGWYFGCVITGNKRIKCWGQALNGQILNGTTGTNLGDIGGETGNGLPWVNH